MILFANNKGNEKNICLSLAFSGIEKIIALLDVEAEAWEYTVRYRQTGMPEEGLMIRETTSTKHANKMVSLYRKLIIQIEKAVRKQASDI